MDELTINKLLRDVRNFLGTFSRDKIPKSIKRNTGLIINTDPSDEEGEHWIAIYKTYEGFCEYFDPYGLPPLHNEFTEFLSLNSTNGVGYSGHQLQCLDCITCGFYCVEYIKYRCNGKSFCQFINSFRKNPYINDKIVRKRISYSLDLMNKNIFMKK